MVWLTEAKAGRPRPKSTRHPVPRSVDRGTGVPGTLHGYPPWVHPSCTRVHQYLRTPWAAAEAGPPAMEGLQLLARTSASPRSYYYYILYIWTRLRLVPVSHPEH